MARESYEIIDGIKCFAPELAYKSEGFNSGSFEKLYIAEANNFWFKARNNLVKHIVRRFTLKKKTIFLEIGCGTGYVLSGLSGLKNLELTGSEIFIQGLQFARLRNDTVTFMQMDAREMPFSNEFDAIGAFDVLEHIKEDEKVIQNVFKALKSDGKFFVTVPQHSFMWSEFDVQSHHQRRYSRSDLLQKLESVGFKITFTSSFMFSLFPLMLLSRTLRNKKTNFALEASSPRSINTIFYILAMMDLVLIKIGLRLPFGGSLVCVATKG